MAPVVILPEPSAQGGGFENTERPARLIFLCHWDSTSGGLSKRVGWTPLHHAPRQASASTDLELARTRRQPWGYSGQSVWKMSRSSSE